MQPGNSPKRQLTGLKKRQQIASANRMIFVWVIVASIAVTVSVVSGQFMVRQLQYNNRVISAKVEASRNLKSNIDNVAVLKKNVSGLVGNENLKSVQGSDDSNELQVIFDALPTTPDRIGFASSLQQVLLPRAGATITQLSVEATASDAATQSATTASDSSASTATAGLLGFNLEATGNYEQIMNVLYNLEKTIRPVEMLDVNVKSSGDGQLTISLLGTTYYQSEISIQPTKEKLEL